MDAIVSHARIHSFAHQLGTKFILGTSDAKKLAIYEDLVGAVGIENSTI